MVEANILYIYMLPLYAANVLNWQPAMLACQIFVQNILCVPLQAAHVMTWQPAMLACQIFMQPYDWQPAMLACQIFVQPYVNMKAINARCYYMYIYI